MPRPDSQWMPLYVADYLADTAHLTRAQHGSYLLLLFSYWRRGALPDDDAYLREVAKCSAKEWMHERKTLIQHFIIEDGSWKHKRLEQELMKAAAIHRAKSEAGTKGSQSRWQKNGTAIVSSLASPQQNDAPSPSPSQKEESISLRSNRAQEPAGWIQWWSEYPHKVGKRNALTAYRRALEKASVGDILLGLRSYISEKPADRQWMNPATFLNGERWNDEPASVVATGLAGGNRQGPASVVDVITKLIAETNLAGSMEGRPVGRGDSGVSVPSDDARDYTERDQDGAGFLDADDADGMFQTYGRLKALDDKSRGAGHRSDGPDAALRKDAPGLPSGRDAPRVDDASQAVEVVAGVAGTERAVGAAQPAAKKIVGGADVMPDIPGFLDRRGEIKGPH